MAERDAQIRRIDRQLDKLASARIRLEQVRLRLQVEQEKDLLESIRRHNDAVTKATRDYLFECELPKR